MDTDKSVPPNRQGVIVGKDLSQLTNPVFLVPEEKGIEETAEETVVCSELCARVHKDSPEMLEELIGKPLESGKVPHIFTEWTVPKVSSTLCSSARSPQLSKQGVYIMNNESRNDRDNGQTRGCGGQAKALCEGPAVSLFLEASLMPCGSAVMCYWNCFHLER